MYIIRKIILLVAISNTIIIGLSQETTDLYRNNAGSVDAAYNYALIEATKQYILGDYTRAARLYNECLKYKPESAAVNFQLSQIFLNSGDIKTAKQYAKKAYQNEDSNKWYLLNLVNIYQGTRETDSAIVLLELLANREQNKIEYKYILASLYERVQKYDKAQMYLDEVENQLGVTKEISLAKYRLYRLLKNEDEALNELRKVLTYFTADYTIYGMLAEYFRDNNMSDSAWIYYTMVIPKYKEIPEVAFSYSEFLLDKNQKDSARNIMIETFSNKEIDKQIKASYFYKVLQDDTLFKKVAIISDTISRIFLADYPDDINVQSIYADIQFRLKNLIETSRILKKIIKKDQMNYIAWEQLLYIENSLYMVDSIVKYSKRAIELFKNRPMPYLYIGAAYLDLKEFNLAIEYLESGGKYADYGPVKIQYYNLLAESYYGNMNYDSTWSNYEKALMIEPGNMIINNNYAYYLAENGIELEKALKMSKYTIRNNPKNSTYLDTYAWILFKLDKVKRAKKTIEKAIMYSEPQDAEILDHYGDILFSLREYKASIDNWNRAIAIDVAKTEILMQKIEVAKERMR